MGWEDIDLYIDKIGEGFLDCEEVMKESAMVSFVMDIVSLNRKRGALKMLSTRYT